MDHIDRVRTNNKPSNLRLATPPENMKNRDPATRAKISESQGRKIKVVSGSSHVGEVFVSIVKAVAALGISQNTISRVVKTGEDYKGYKL